MLFFHDIPVVGANPTRYLTVLAFRALSKGLAQLPGVPNHLHVPVLIVLASSVFRFDATALSLATVRWRGVRTPCEGTLE